MAQRLRVIQYGVGSIGSSIVKLLLERGEMEIVGALDVSEQKIGKDLGEVVSVGRKLGITVSNDPNYLFSKTRADIVLHSTSSFLKDVYPQITRAVEAEMNVISTAEELAYPYSRHPEVAEEIDQTARKHGVTVLGAGVNPGFVMDALVVALTGVCSHVRRVKATRIVDASTRRLPLQRKVGAGLDVESFKEKVVSGTPGHVGLLESIDMIAGSLGWKLEKVEQKTDPVIAKENMRTEFFELKAGTVAGIRQIGRGVKEGEELITLDLQMYVGAKDPRDSIAIEGTPNIDLTIRGGIHGDIATAAIVVNSIPRVMAAHPGLVTMKDLPMPALTINNLFESTKR